MKTIHKPTTTNPFTMEHVKRQIDRFEPGKNRQPIKDGNVELDWIQPHGRLDDFLNVNMRFMDFPVPVLLIDGDIWMSLTPMEIQSAHVAIQLASGEVATSGLGLGYFTLEAAMKDNVSTVTVYERNPHVIEIFKTRMSLRKDVGPYYKKIKIIEGDVRENMKGEMFDFVFMDPYQTILPDELITDAELFQRENHIGIYWPWGMELITMMATTLGIVDRFQLYPEEIDLFRHHRTTEALPEDDRSDAMLADLRMPIDPEYLQEFVEEAWEACGRNQNVIA